MKYYGIIQNNAIILPIADNSVFVPNKYLEQAHITANYIIESEKECLSIIATDLKGENSVDGNSFVCHEATEYGNTVLQVAEILNCHSKRPIFES